MAENKAQAHVNAVVESWFRSGRQAAAETLVMYDGAGIDEAREAARLLREQTETSLHEPVISTANWLVCASGECPEGAL